MSNEHGLILPVIMCGGSGTRLWPASRESLPKQFIPLFGERSTFQAAAQRVADPSIFLKPLVIANLDSRFIVAEQLSEIGMAADIILEPIRRDSAAAVAVAAVRAAHEHPDAVVLIMAADHVIGDPESFTQACRIAARSAARGHIMTFGIAPSFPATSYGYIAKGPPLEKEGGFKVERFVEKPDANTAAKYIGQGYLWNGGYFLFMPQVMHAELGRFAPDILEAATSALEGASVDLDFICLDKAAFERSPKTSIDYAVIEKTQLAGVLPVSFSWSDVGSWDAVWNVADGDESGNVMRGNVEVIGTQNSLVHSDHLLTTVVGLDDVVVVTTPDAVLVSRAKSAEGEGSRVAFARQEPAGGGRARARAPALGLVSTARHRLAFSGQAHHGQAWAPALAAEAFSPRRALGGGARRSRSDGGRKGAARPRERGRLHADRLPCTASPTRAIPLELIEVQVGTYTGEDDIVRLEDVYGRS